MRLDSGNFSWASEAVTRKTRIIDVAYNSTNNELVRTKTLVKGCIVQIDATPFRQWWEKHYAQTLLKRKSATGDASVAAENEARQKLPKFAARQALAIVENAIEDQFNTGRLYAAVASRPGQSGRCDGYILEGKELEFYLRKIKSKK